MDLPFTVNLFAMVGMLWNSITANMFDVERI